MREYGSEHPAVLLPDGYFETFNQYGKCTWLRSGREALHLVALNVNENDNENKPVVLMPAYCCHSMVDPFEKAGWKVVYYRLNEDLTADIDYLRQLLNEEHPKAVLTMNFYGSASTVEAVELIKSNCPKCACIEDFSHCTFSLASIYNPQVDYYVTSIRKSVGVCDGSVIISKNALDETYIEEGETEFMTSRRDSQKLKAEYIYSQQQEKKNIFFPELRRQEGELDAFEGVHHISKTGMEMLGVLNGEMIAYARRCNMKHILELLGGKVESVPGIERCLDGAPFSLPILVKNRDEVQQKLAKRGVYAPVLWPICDEARAVCPVSARMADEMLSIPIDQRYNYDDIEDIAKIVNDNVNDNYN